MSRSWARTYPRSGPDPASGPWISLDRAERIALLPAFALLVAWFVYTRLYFYLHPRGLTFSLSPFMYLTGKPDPACGLTRTFAWMWVGDLGQAVRVYPLGPLVFVISAGLTVYLAVALATGRRLRVVLPRRTWTVLIVIGVVALAANWASKLIWLGM